MMVVLSVGLRFADEAAAILPLNLFGYIGLTQLTKIWLLRKNWI
jgi:hypothetical protein